MMHEVMRTGDTQCNAGEWPYYFLEDFGGVFLFSCNYDFKDCKINTTLHRELLQWWADLRADFKLPFQQSRLYLII